MVQRMGRQFVIQNRHLFIGRVHGHGCHQIFGGSGKQANAKLGIWLHANEAELF